MIYGNIIIFYPVKYHSLLSSMTGKFLLCPLVSKRGRVIGNNAF